MTVNRRDGDMVRKSRHNSNRPTIQILTTEGQLCRPFFCLKVGPARPQMRQFIFKVTLRIAAFRYCLSKIASRTFQN